MVLSHELLYTYIYVLGGSTFMLGPQQVGTSSNCHRPTGPPFRPARCVVCTMPPKKRTSNGGGSQAAPKKGKKGAVQELPGVPPDALKLPHMSLFDTWWFL